MALNGIRSESPDARYTQALEDTIRRLEARIARLETDNAYLKQRVNK